MEPTKSQVNAVALRQFVPSLHTAPYAAIDPSNGRLPQPYTVCIIGGRGAAGSALARSYAKAGASGIILGARTVHLLEEVCKEVKEINPSTKVVIKECDVASNQSVAALAASAKSEFQGHLDAVVVNAGSSGPMIDDILQEPPDAYQQAFDVNAVGLYHAAHYFLPLLLDTPGGAKSFVAISSIAAAAVGGPLAHIHYCVSKAAQVRMIEMIYEQYAGRGLFCASVHPGGMKSGLSELVPEEYQHILVDNPDLVGAFCVWLTRDNGTRSKEALNGRFLSCKWDVDELAARFDEILDKDLLRFRIAVE